MFFGGLNGDGFADESDYDYGSYSEGPYYRNRPSPPKSITCYRCGCRDLDWKNTENGWRLTYGSGHKLWGKLHACDIEGEPVPTPKKNPFNDVKYSIDEEGAEYTFECYSNWNEIKDERFHTLRLNFLDAMEALRDYVADQADEDYWSE